MEGAEVPLGIYILQTFNSLNALIIVVGNEDKALHFLRQLRGILRELIGQVRNYGSNSCTNQAVLLLIVSDGRIEVRAERSGLSQRRINVSAERVGLSLQRSDAVLVGSHIALECIQGVIEQGVETIHLIVKGIYLTVNCKNSGILSSINKQLCSLGSLERSVELIETSVEVEHASGEVEDGLRVHAYLTLNGSHTSLQGIDFGIGEVLVAIEIAAEGSDRTCQLSVLCLQFANSGLESHLVSIDHILQRTDSCFAVSNFSRDSVLVGIHLSPEC